MFPNPSSIGFKWGQRGAVYTTSAPLEYIRFKNSSEWCTPALSNTTTEFFLRSWGDQHCSTGKSLFLTHLRNISRLTPLLFSTQHAGRTNPSVLNAARTDTGLPRWNVSRMIQLNPRFDQPCTLLLSRSSTWLSSRNRRHSWSYVLTFDQNSRSSIADLARAIRSSFVQV